MGPHHAVYGRTLGGVTGLAHVKELDRTQLAAGLHCIVVGTNNYQLEGVAIYSFFT